MSIGLIGSLLVLGLVGVVATWVASQLNRGHLSLQRKARAIVRERLERTPVRHSIDSFIGSCVSIKDHAKARLLLEEISKLLQVSVDLLTFDATFREVLRVPVSELGVVGISKSGLGLDYVEPYTYDLLYVLERLSDKKLWDELWRVNPELPRSEEALADFVMEMTPAEILGFFAPLVSFRR